MNKINVYIALIDLLDWTQKFIKDSNSAINELTNFQRFAHAKLESEDRFSYVVTFADNVWVRCDQSSTNDQRLINFLDKIIEVIEYANNSNLNPWCVVTSGWMTFDISDQTLVSGGNITDLRSQHIPGIGEAQVRAACAEKTLQLTPCKVWVEKKLISAYGRNYVIEKEESLFGNKKWLFNDRNEFVAVLKKEKGKVLIK
jgi:hypothetical protein